MIYRILLEQSDRLAYPISFIATWFIAAFTDLPWWVEAGAAALIAILFVRVLLWVLSLSSGAITYGRLQNEKHIEYLKSQITELRKERSELIKRVRELEDGK